MTEQGKEAVEELKKQLRLAMNIDDVATTIRNGYAQIILNLIEKLQKENEEYSKQLDLDYVDKNYISKKKIEDTIEELKVKLEDISRRREKSKTKEEETVLWCLEIRIDERIKTLQELL